MVCLFFFLTLNIFQMQHTGNSGLGFGWVFFFSKQRGKQPQLPAWGGGGILCLNKSGLAQKLG